MATKEEERAKRIGEKVVREHWCQLCGGKLTNLGISGQLGGIQLYGCLDCRAVYWI